MGYGSHLGRRWWRDRRSQLAETWKRLCALGVVGLGGRAVLGVHSCRLFEVEGHGQRASLTVMKLVLAIMALALAFVLGRFSAGPSEGEAIPPVVVLPESSLVGERSPASGAAERPLADDGMTTAAEHDPGSDEDSLSVADLVGEKDPIRRTEILAELLRSLDKENARETFKALLGEEQRKRSDSEMHELGLVLRAWGRLDGKVAMEDAQTLLAENPAKVDGKRNKIGKKDKWDAGLLGSALEGWASQDLQGASAYVDAVEDKGDQLSYRKHLVESLLAKGPEQAMAYIQGLPEDDRSRARYVSMVANDVLDKGIDGAITWVDSLPEELRGGAMNEIAAAYAREDLDGAIVWATENADDMQANKALAKVTGRWASLDPRAASEYLAALPASVGKDSAVEGFATRLASEDPASAAVWATTIQDERLRARTVYRIAQSWSRSDEEAARTWISEQGFPEKVLTKGKKKPQKVRKADKQR